MNVACNQCGKRFRAADEHRGKTVPCPNCQGPVRVPTVSAAANIGQSFVIVCGSCQNKLRASNRLVGKRVDCPKCGQQVHVARPAPQKSPPHQTTAPAESWHVRSHDGQQDGPVPKSTFRINWIAQALPLSPQQYLLVAQFIPINKALGMLGFDLGVTWFANWRDQFLGMANHLPPQGNSRLCPYDFGSWGPVAYEVLQLKVF